MIWVVMDEADSIAVARIRGEETCLVINDPALLPDLTNLAQTVADGTGRKLKLISYRERVDTLEIVPR